MLSCWGVSSFVCADSYFVSTKWSSLIASSTDAAGGVLCDHCSCSVGIGSHGAHGCETIGCSTGDAHNVVVADHRCKESDKAADECCFGAGAYSSVRCGVLYTLTSRSCSLSVSNGKDADTTSGHDVAAGVVVESGLGTWVVRGCVRFCRLWTWVDSKLETGGPCITSFSLKGEGRGEGPWRLMECWYVAKFCNFLFLYCPVVGFLSLSRKRDLARC